MKNVDVGPTIKLFIRNFEAESMVKITKFFFQNSISTSDKNILTDIPRLKFEFKKGSRIRSSSVFMKIPSLYSIFLPELINTMFDREAHFYDTVLPDLYQLGSCEPFSAKCYAVTVTKAFVMEDLSISGYKSGNSIEQLDMDQILISLKLLAKYHALGYKYIRSLSDNDPRMLFIKSHPPIILDKQKKTAFFAYTQMLQYELRRELFQKIIKKEDEILAEPRSLKHPNKKSMTVLIHADYRTDNILFKTDEMYKVSQVKIIDWQLCGEANPVLDLIYFFITSVPIEIFKKEDNLLKDTYLKKLNEELSLLQSDRVYDRLEFDRDMSYYKYFYLRLLLYNWPAMMKAQQPGSKQNKYIQSAVGWVKYLKSKGMI